MNSCKITIQRNVGEQWPVVLEQRTTDSALEIRTLGSLSLNVMALSTQVTPRDYGVMLGQALFQGAVREAFLHARAQSDDHLSVQLLVEAPDLSTLRWERLCAPLDEHWHFLVHDQRAPLSLAPSSPSTRQFPHLRREDLRTLVLVASPQGLERYRLSPFNVQATIASVRAALGAIPCDVLSTTPDAIGPPTLDSLCERLTSTSYSLLHVVCHGRYSRDIGDTVIYLANVKQQVDPVSGQRLVTRMSQLRGEHGLPQFAFLATCESASAEAEGVLGGLAHLLVRDLGMPAVLAMTETVSISTVEALTSQFYRRLVAHGHVDLALAEACAGVVERADSLVPALYSRLGARPLFDQQIIPSDQQPLSLTEKQRTQNRTRMLDRVQSIWIDGVLEPSVQGATQIDLELEHKPSAVVTPLWSVLREFDKTGPLSSADASIVQVYDHANGEVLILGEPGSGKTTLLLELARDLLERARQDEAHPMPVIFPLSSWATKRLVFTTWLASELHSRYQVPLPLATFWIEKDQVLPLLDGLDEVAAPHREACVEAINAYRQGHGLIPTTVCSRQTDYFALTTRLLLRTAVVVQPLTAEQVASYLSSGGERLDTLREILHSDADLRELASTPLMLNVLTVVYQETPSEEINVTSSLVRKREQVFAFYVQRMLIHRGTSLHYTLKQTRHWLSWLAQQMKQKNQTVFYIEYLQPDWLAGAQELQAYDRWAIQFPDIFMGMLVFLAISTPFNLLSSFAIGTSILIPVENTSLCSLLGGLLSRGNRVQHVEVVERKTERAHWHAVFRLLGSGGLIGLAVGLIGGLTVGLIGGLIGGLSSGFSSILLQVILKKGNKTTSEFRAPKFFQETKWRHLIESAWFRNGVLVGLISGLISGLIGGLTNRPYVGLSFGLLVGLNFGMIFGISSAILSIPQIGTGKSGEIFLVDKLVWTWKSLFSKRHVNTSLRVLMFMGLSVGLICGLIVGLRYRLYVGLSYGLSVGLSVGLSYWLLFGLSQGISSEIIADQHRVVPNQGIRHSALNGLQLGLISIGIATLCTTLISSLIGGVNSPNFTPPISELIVLLIGSPISGLSYGLLIGLHNGGLAWLRHSVLCRLLWRAGFVPRNYPRFLDFATERVLLRKVGGGYIFVHRLLLEYFASLGNTSSRAETDGQIQPTQPVS